MGECNTEVTRNKRALEDSELESNSPDSKRANSVAAFKTDAAGRHESVSRVDPEVESVKHIPLDILDILDDSETVQNRDPEGQDLESVIKSFEEEILHQPASFSQQGAVVEPASGPGESQPDLGYLFGASDDELGLPPTTTSSSSDGDEATNEASDLTTVATNALDSIELGNMIEFEDEFPRYDSFDFGIDEVPAVVDNRSIPGENNNGSTVSGDFVTVDGLFDFSGLSWQPESLPAS